jgi:hypothetical protein
VEVVINRLLNLIRSPIRDYEKEIICAVELGLDSVARELFKKQIERVNLVQRHSKDKEVYLYPMKAGKPFYDKTIQFPNAKEVCPLAQVSIGCGDREVVPVV